ncbi:hypothetical protein [Butyrivibrio sp. FC2001]|uniref:hypothetical protein n=1 Tax=Butyrivibrio sp. FC2001 TaxID=1280671 RepID=UPI000478FBEA|nr:hypothetical protein [Butyrivibrio sp. FC2001]
MISSLYCGEKIISDEDITTIVFDALDDRDGEDPKFEFLRFFFMQQQRSLAIHENQAKMFEELKLKNTRIADVNTSCFVDSLMIFHAEQIATNISTYFHTWHERLENKTDNPFITCVCTAVNLIGMEISDRQEFYFQLRPRVAIKLCKIYRRARYSKNDNFCIDVNDE